MSNMGDAHSADAKEAKESKASGMPNDSAEVKQRTVEQPNAAATMSEADELQGAAPSALLSEMSRLNLEEKIQLTSDDLYYVHSVDRWPDTGAYGDGRYIHIGWRGRYIIDSVDAAARVILAHKIVYIGGRREKTKVLIAVGDTEPSWDMFMRCVGTPWDVTYKGMWRDDEDYTDYAPHVYKTFDALATDQGEFYHL